MKKIMDSCVFEVANGFMVFNAGMDLLGQVEGVYIPPSPLPVFDRSICTFSMSMKASFIVNEAKEALESGNCVVIGLQTTGEVC
jgi:hypothetical protein